MRGSRRRVTGGAANRGGHCAAPCTRAASSTWAGRSRRARRRGRSPARRTASLRASASLPEPRDAPSYILHRERPARLEQRDNIARGLETKRRRRPSGSTRRDEADGGRVGAHQRLGRPRAAVGRQPAGVQNGGAAGGWRASLDQQRMLQATRAAHDERTVAHLDNVVVAHADAQERNVQARAWTRKELEHQTAAEQRAAIASKQAGPRAPRARSSWRRSAGPRAGGQQPHGPLRATSLN